MTNSFISRLTDIIEAIDIIRDEMVDVTLHTFKENRRKQWLVERGIEIISEASRHLPDELKTRHSDIPWAKVAGIGNVLRHDYENVAPDVLWYVVKNNLPHLEMVCRDEYEAEIEQEQHGSDL
jgi:uncharacterized protein with HEPN domain